MNRPIPAFYCVYLLRSTTAVRANARVYIGSTPNPKRRLRQHNGEIKGGAKSTDTTRNGRHWEMALIVAGFPSKIAALQFEWSWQNTHLTRHVGTEDKKPLDCKIRANRHGRPVKKPQRPLAQLDRKLADLHTLLRSNSFNRWPLDVRFFNLKAYQHWQTKTLPSTPFRVPQNTQVTFEDGDSTGLGPEQDTATGKVSGINAIDVSYGPLRKHALKSQTLLSQSTTVACYVCKSSMRANTDLFAICPNVDCGMTAHLTCLSSRSSSDATGASHLLPTRLNCPDCESPISWTSLAREASIRVRGGPEIEKLLKPPRAKKDAAVQPKTATAVSICNEADEEDVASEAESGDSIVVRDDIIAGNFYREEDALSEQTDNLSDLDLPEPAEIARLHLQPALPAITVPDSDTDDIDDLSA